jgi:hypothetical protein
VAPRNEKQGMNMAQRFATLRGYDSLLERADWSRHTHVEYAYHIIPATGCERRVVDPCGIQTSGYDGDQRATSLYNGRPFLTVVGKVLLLERFGRNIPQLH